MKHGAKGANTGGQHRRGAGGEGHEQKRTGRERARQVHYAPGSHYYYLLPRGQNPLSYYILYDES